jgi:hypothetical protein
VSTSFTIESPIPRRPCYHCNRRSQWLVAWRTRHSAMRRESSASSLGPCALPTNHGAAPHVSRQAFRCHRFVGEVQRLTPIPCQHRSRTSVLVTCALYLYTTNRQRQDSLLESKPTDARFPVKKLSWRPSRHLSRGRGPALGQPPVRAQTSLH